MFLCVKVIFFNLLLIYPLLWAKLIDLEGNIYLSQIRFFCVAFLLYVCKLFYSNGPFRNRVKPAHTHFHRVKTRVSCFSMMLVHGGSCTASLLS